MPDQDNDSETTANDKDDASAPGGGRRRRVGQPPEQTRRRRGPVADPFAVQADELKARSDRGEASAEDESVPDDVTTPDGDEDTTASAEPAGDDDGGASAKAQTAAAEEGGDDEDGADQDGDEEADSVGGDGQPRRRRRRRGRRGRGGRGNQQQGGTAAEAGEGEESAADHEADDDAKTADASSDGEKKGGVKGGAKSGGARKQDQKKQSDGAETDAEKTDGAEATSGDEQSGQKPSGSDGENKTGRRRRRRGRRGRGKRGKGGQPQKSGGSGDSQSAPTRLSARGKGGGGRRRVPTVSAETRRAINTAPPKRMLVTVGKDRTQIAVLEERTLVEHYVTDASEASYVGNIYKGRVQNVLPGMEAAFVDIGKGRNGVLYAGEVNYDEADRDGGLPRIEQALKSGQAVMVQVTKDPMGTKGARLTQHLSLAGRYCVLAPGDDMLGISRKLPDDQRERLRKILKGLKPEGFGLIVRTAAESATAEQLEADVERLLARWQKVTDAAEKAKPLDSVYAEPQLVLRVIRDVFGPEHTQLIIDDEELADQVRSYLEEVSPEHVDKVVTYRGDDRLFDGYEVTTQIRRALERKVWLKSGGYLIIEKTEAMWVIDVNTGKFVGKDNLEETVLRNNIEAAEEIARQLRLRDMGGIIVIDFVDMIVPANRDEVLKRFKRELARDKTKSRVMDISKLGLVQMTRKNVSKGLMEAFTVPTDDVIPGRKIIEDLLG